MFFMFGLCFLSVVLSFISSVVIILLRKRELVAWLLLCSCCHMCVFVLRLFLAMPWVGVWLRSWLWHFLLCGSTKCSPTQYAPFSSILCTLHTQYAPLEHFVYPAYTICYQRSILCRVGTYDISVVVRGYTICSSWKHVSWYLPFFLTVLSTSICLSYEPYV